MAILTPENVFRKWNVDGVPDSLAHTPEKSQIIQLLNLLFGTSRGGWVVARTRAELLAITPAAETDGGVVLNDPNPALNGYYQRDAAAWVRERGFPDTYAFLTVSEATPNAITAEANAGVDPATILLFALVPAADNTGPVTVNGVALNGFDGEPLGAGFIQAGAAILFAKVGSTYRLLVDHRFQMLADAASADAERAETAADIATSAAADIVAQGNVPIYSTVMGLAGLTIPAALQTISLNGYSAMNDGGEVDMKRITRSDILSQIYPTPPLSVLAYLPMNGIVGTSVFRDYSQYARPIIVSSNPTISNAMKLHDYPMAYFDGNDRIGFADSADFAFGAGDFSLDLFIHPTNMATVKTIFCHLTNTTSYLELNLQTDGRVRLRETIGGTITNIVTSAAGAVVINQTSHIALVREGTSWKILANKRVSGSATLARTLADQTGEIRLGLAASGINDAFVGYMAHFRIQNFAYWKTGREYADSWYGTTAQLPDNPLPAPEYAFIHPNAIARSVDRTTPSLTTDVDEGGYWINKGWMPNLAQFGGVADGVQSNATGTDNTVAFRALHDFCAVKKIPGWVVGSYMVGSEVPQFGPQPLVGLGWESSCIIRRCASYETGMRIYGGGLVNMRLIAGAYESRGGGRGDRQCNITFGDQKFTNGAPRFVTDFLVDNIQTWAIDLGNSPSFALCFMHSVDSGHIGYVTDEGSPYKRQSGGILQHWGGQGEGDNVNINYTNHIRRVRIDRLNFENMIWGIQLSATSNIDIGSISMDGIRQAMLLFVGDETNQLTQTLPDTIARGLRIGQMFVTNAEDESTMNLFEVSSLGSSTFRRYPSPDAGNSRLANMLAHSAIIDQITITGSPNAGKTLFYSFVAQGPLQVRQMTYANVAGPPVLISRSEGVGIDILSGESTYTGTHVNIARSSDCYINGGTIEGPLVATGVGITGADETATLSAGYSAGATEFLLNSPGLTERARVGQAMTIGTNTVEVTAYAPAGNLRIFTTPIAVDVAPGATVTLIGQSDGIKIGLKTKGFLYGYDFSNCNAVGKACIAQGAGTGGARTRTKSHVTMADFMGINNGVNGGTTYDVECQVDSQLLLLGGDLGIRGAQTQYNIRVPTADGSTDNRLKAIGTRCHQNVSGAITASSSTDRFLNGVTDSVGALVT